MAFKNTVVNTLKFKKGDMTYVNTVLKDYKPMQKSSGVHLRFDTAAKIEALGTAIEAATDLVFYGYSGQHQAKDTVKMNTSKTDTVGDAISASFRVIGTHPTTNEEMTMSIFIPKSVDPLKVGDIATALKACEAWTDEATPVKLTNLKVSYTAVA